MKKNPKSALSLQKEVIGNATMNLTEKLNLALDLALDECLQGKIPCSQGVGG